MYKFFFSTILFVFILMPSMAQDETIREFTPSETEISQVSLSPDETQFSVLSFSRTGQETITPYVLDIFSLETDELLHTITDPEPQHALYSPDGSTLFVAYRGSEVALHDAITLEELVRVEGVTVSAGSGQVISFNADGSLIMIKGTSIELYSGEDLSFVSEITSPNEQSINEATFSPDGTQIAFVDFADRVTIVDAESGDIINEFPSGLETVNDLQWLSDGSIVESNLGRELSVLDAETGDTLAFYDFEFIVRAVATYEDQYLMSTSENEVLLWQPAVSDESILFSYPTSRNPTYLEMGATLILAAENTVYVEQWQMADDMESPEAEATEESD